ncbi:MAG: hypothetical protein ACJA2B_001123 [Candidatus Endobugula sp.]|jgi:hypothetical protein
MQLEGLLYVSTSFSISFLALFLPFTLPIIAHAEEIVLVVAEARVNTTTSSTQSTAYMQIVNYSKKNRLR